MKEEIKFKEDIDWSKVSLLIKIGLIGAFIILIGDFLMGWGVRDESLSGIEGQVSQYLAISDSRMFWSSFLGLLGVPIAAVGHFGVYKLLKPYSQKYAKLYALGGFGFLTFGGAGVHVSSVESAFFYKYMTAADPNTALATSMKFVSYFPLPIYIALLVCWIILVYVHIRAVAKGFSPYPRWCWVFSMLVGTLLASLFSIFGNHAIANAIKVGAFSLGNIWTLTGHLLMLGRAKENYEGI
ncbi:MAG TPA: hypothetical protein GX726_01570 [Clostridiales bacterium]|nr:hypothetical protein [Clostridiales bacterium]